MNQDIYVLCNDTLFDISFAKDILHYMITEFHYLPSINKKFFVVSVFDAYLCA